ncbi:hypothetical protein KPH14_000829 [Odynerus spinipes]|uniref:Peptidase aspartic putative domain-containing protein n=1 Tax=Odynerus spinipes TaxID=1348599 RepID=A0AAD9VHY7_9HYME|nr:hypothetical protein KPH14_000829 [Odynerus spinipes]
MNVPQPTKSYVMHARTNDDDRVMLATTLVYLTDRKGHRHECRALLDAGSQPNFLTEDFCKRLDLPCDDISASVEYVRRNEQVIKQKTRVELISITGGFKTSLKCLVVPDLTNYVPDTTFSAASLRIPENIVLADPNFAQPRRIDMLIGGGLFWDLLCAGQYKPAPDHPTVQKTLLGWVVAGSINRPLKGTKGGKPHFSCHLATNKKLHEQIEKFWMMENLEPTSAIPSVDTMDICEQHFQRTTTCDAEGRFVVNVPWNQEVENLGDSQQHAFQRFNSLERKLRRQPDLKSEYIKFMEEYENLGHMREVPSPLDTGYYLPRHAVIKADSTTTKVRVVFDGSAKTTSGLSLNDVQLVGPTVQQDLFSILIRFRKHRYVLSGDIAKMYRQIRIEARDCRFQRILWRSDSLQPIKTDFYVDDPLTGSESIEEAVTLKRELISILAEAGFELRKWTSNKQQILDIKGTSNVQLPTEGNHDSKTLEIAQIFDPLGLVGPATIQAKIVMQRLWQLEICWDESLPQDIHTCWMEFRNELDQLDQIRIPRRILISNAQRIELHGFCDASEKAYAVLLAQLMHKVKAAIDMEIHDEYHWSDSTMTLNWIRASPSKWQTFVANRTTEIQRLSPKNWRHITSSDNPADIISRGISPSLLLSTEQWWKDPTWLLSDDRHLLATEIEEATHKVIKMVQAECFTPEIRHLERSKAVSKASQITTLNPFWTRRDFLGLAVDYQTPLFPSSSVIPLYCLRNMHLPH